MLRNVLEPKITRISIFNSSKCSTRLLAAQARGSLVGYSPYLSQSLSDAKENINSKIVSAKPGGLCPTAESNLSLFSS